MNTFVSYTVCERLYAICLSLAIQTWQYHDHLCFPSCQALAVATGAIRNFASCERGRLELAGEPGSVPLLCRLIDRHRPPSGGGTLQISNEVISAE